MKRSWLLVALVPVILGAPNSTIMRVAVLDSDPFYLTLCRFGLIGLVCIPFIIRARKTLFSKEARRDVLLASIFLTVALNCYTFALLYSQASYVTIMSLIYPLVFILLSARFFKEQLNRRVATGITLSMIGAMVIVVLPIALSQNGTSFYPLATVLGVINSFSYALAIIYMRRANEKGVSLWAIVGGSALFVTIVSLILFVLFGDTSNTPNNTGFWLAVGYTGVVAALVGRVLNVRAYEHVGAAVMSALGSVEMFIAILIPVFVLHEKLSPAMVIGGIIILIGVYVAEHHKHPHVKHHITMRHH